MDQFPIKKKFLFRIDCLFSAHVPSLSVFFLHTYPSLLPRSMLPSITLLPPLFIVQKFNIFITRQSYCVRFSTRRTNFGCDRFNLIKTAVHFVIKFTDVIEVNDATDAEIPITLICCIVLIATLQSNRNSLCKNQTRVLEFVQSFFLHKKV